VARFSQDNFDPKEWINSTLQTEPGQSKEAAAGSLVMKLQLMIARLNSALEEQCSAVVQSVPRIVREAEQLEQEAGLLRDKLIMVKADVAKVEAETAENMGALVRMDLVKERVAGTRRALQEADNWTSLDSQVEDAFDSDDLDTVAERLAGMQNSLRLLSHVADYQERVAHLEQQRNRLEATLSPQLVTAFSNLDTEAALRLVAMFRSMERGGQLTKYYHKCVRAGLLQRWATIVSEGEGESAKVWIGQFYTELVARLREHQAWVAQVFPEEQPGHLLAQLVSAVLASLDPSIDFCLETAAKLCSSELDLLVEVKTSTDAFATSLTDLLAGASEQDMKEVGKALYKPFKAPVSRYGDLEAKTLISEVASWSTGGKDTIEEIHSLVSCVARIGASVESASKRCTALTQGCAFPGLASAVARALDSHLDRYRRIMRRLEKRKVVVDDDWSVLQHCLSANQATGDLLLQVESLDLSLCHAFLESTRHFLGSDAPECPALQQHHTLLCDQAQCQALKKLYESVVSKTGSTTPLLQQSVSLLSAACSDLQKATFNIMFHPISSQLELVPGLELWGAQTAGEGTMDSATLPDFSFSPGEYITCIGEYLMTLPQHLEPYMSQDNAALCRAFRESVFPGSSALEAGAAQSPADFLLGCISASTCTSYISYISSIPSLTSTSARQLGVDISYLGEILEDLGHPLSADLASVAALSKLQLSELNSSALSSGGHSSRACSLVARLRGLGDI